jgi:anaerobic ribonucleoside-triphosphate reductase activating protein
MNIAKIETCSIANGKGFRVVLWCSGCSHRCKGCHNPETWDKGYGKEFKQEDKELLFKLLNDPHIQGITFSGGDPLFQTNIKEVGELLKEIKEKFPTKDIWLYTGYTWEELIIDILRKPLLQYIDVLIDGKFILKERDITIAFRGSRNQRIIDVQQSLKNNKIILKMC